MKKHILVFCGGQSSEHEVSLRSAANVVRAINPEKYDVTVIGIDHQGGWHKLPTKALLEHHGMGVVEDQSRESSDLTVCLGGHKELVQVEGRPALLGKIDVAIPVLHGPNGEDGTIQGLLRLANVAFVGSDILGSAICMDKEVTKRLARDAGIPIGDFLVYRDRLKALAAVDEVEAKLGFPCFVKPCNLGSSVGINKAKSREDYVKAVDEAFQYDSKIIVEKFIAGREIECAVLGNNNPRASKLAEIIPHHEFYSYEAKYLDDNGASLVISPDLPEEVTWQVQQYALKTFEALECADLARVDFFVANNKDIYLNEVNTFPGFTSVSMYPQLWQASGISYGELIEELIELAHERHQKRLALKH